MLEKLSKFIIKYHRSVLISCAVLTLVMGFFTSKLQLRMQLMDLLPENEPEVVAYNHAMDNFRGIDAIVVGVEGREKDIIAFIQNVSKKIKPLENVDRIITENEFGFFEKHGFLLLKEQELKNFQGILTASSLKDFVSGINDNFEKEYISDQDTQKLSKDRREMLAYLNTMDEFIKLINPNLGAGLAPTQMDHQPPASKIKENANKFIRGERYFISPDKSMGLFFVRTPLSFVEVDKVVRLVNLVEKIVKENQDKYKVKAGISGGHVLCRDEMVVSEKDMSVTSVLSFILILIIFIIGFKLIRYSVLAIIPLIVGIIWALGITYLIIGSLSIMTAMMSAILIGLGIDYAIHIVALFTEERHKGTEITESIRQVYKKTVKGIITGSVTTACGFMIFGISTFKGFKEFGIVLGIGIISVLISSIIILPSLLINFARKKVKIIKPKTTFFIKMEKVVLHRPWLVIIMVVILALISIVKFKDIQFSRDIKDIEAKNLETFAINDKMIEKFDFSADISIAVTKTLDEARILKDKTDDLATIGFVESITSYVPSPKKQLQRRRLLAKIKKQAAKPIEKGLYLPSLKQELLRLKDNLIELSDLSYIAGEKKLVEKCDKILKANTIQTLANNILEYKDSIQKVQNIFIKELKNKVRASNSAKEITISDLPENIRSMYIGKDKTFMTTIYAEGDVWLDKFQKIHLADLNTLGLPLTGSFILSNKVMQISGEEGQRILLYVIIIIFLILWLDFRKLRYAVMAMLPMVLSLILLIGIMSIFKIKFNFVNIIALPIIIGIGVDDGVHIIHRYLIEKDLIPALRSTGRAILLTTLTTSAAFGTLMLAKYQGFVTFGLLLVLGVFLAYFLTILLLTSLIKVLD